MLFFRCNCLQILLIKIMSDLMIVNNSWCIINCFSIVKRNFNKSSVVPGKCEVVITSFSPVSSFNNSVNECRLSSICTTYYIDIFASTNRVDCSRALLPFHCLYKRRQARHLPVLTQVFRFRLHPINHFIWINRFW